MANQGRALKTGFVVAGIAVLTLAVPKVFAGFQEDDSVKAYLAKRQQGIQAGMPTSALVFARQVRPEDNAALLLKAAGDMTPRFPEVTTTAGGIRTVMGVSEPGDAELLDNAIKGAGTYFTLLETAARKPDCYFEHTWADPLNVLFPEYAKMKNAVKWMAARANLKASKGDTAGAFQDLDLAMAIARHAGRGDIYMGHLVEIACTSIAQVTAINILYNVNGSPEAVLGATRIGRSKVQVGIGKAVRNDWFAYASFTGKEDIVKFATLMVPFSADDEIPMPSQSQLLQGLVNAMDMTLKVGAIAKDSSTTLAQKSALIDQLYDSSNATVATKPDSFVINPRYDQALGAYIKSLSTSEMLVATASVYDYRNKHGKFPARLSDAVSPLPVDYWADAPVRYRPEGKGFIVWTCGVNRKDDNGTNGNFTNERLDQVIDMSSPGVIHYRISTAP